MGCEAGFSDGLTGRLPNGQPGAIRDDPPSAAPEELRRVAPEVER